MTLDTLKATEADFGADREFLVRYMDAYNRTAIEGAADITEIWLAEARDEIRSDLPAATGHAADWSGFNASIARATDEPYWRRLLSRAQLYLAYRACDEGPDSLNRARMAEARAAYTAALSGLRRLLADGLATEAQTMTIRL